MSQLRDLLLPMVDSLRGFEAVFGTRRFLVNIVRRVWSGAQQGEGTATDTSISLIPKPRVRDVTASNLTLAEQEMMALGTNRVSGQLYRINKITPRYTPASAGGTVTGGFLAEQLRLWPNRDTGYVENLVQLIGDDGYLRECTQVFLSQDRMFEYSMLVKEIDRPRTYLTSVTVTPSTSSIVHGTTQQMVCTGTFSGGAISVLTAISAWTTSNAAAATVDIYGNVTAVAAGSATITATVLGQTANTSVTVT